MYIPSKPAPAFTYMNKNNTKANTTSNSTNTNKANTTNLDDDSDIPKRIIIQRQGPKQYKNSRTSFIKISP
jgi:hypothetical protein